MNFLAHSENLARVSEPLKAHLVRVAERAREYARAFGATDEAYVAGLLHDLGKYSVLFQRRLLNKERGIDHWSAGAWYALRRYKASGITAALAIQGHHIGLQTRDEDDLRKLDPTTPVEKSLAPLRRLDDDETLEVLLQRMHSDGLQEPPEISDSARLSDDLKYKAGWMLNVRMVFSALVDADFIETEAHFDGLPDGTRNYRPEGPPLRPDLALQLLRDHIAKLPRGTGISPAILSVRDDLLTACLQAADSPPGLFTLTAPTGSGKTLAMLAFALAHAARHQLRRVVVVIPYLNIIEQTAAIYRDIFAGALGEDYVLEVHSLAQTVAHEIGTDQTSDAVDSDAQYRRNALAENWDAPIVVTTSVQCLESLFANRPAACRKLHRLAKSVVLFDEVQTLPHPQIVPTLATLSHLARSFGTTVVFSTATQPAFGSLHDQVAQYARSGWRPTEIVPAGFDLFGRTRRARVRWPRGDQRISWVELAGKLAEHPQALCIVNKKRHARELYESLQAIEAEGLYHLSTNMCPVHRRDILRTVSRNLGDGSPCRLISTQCVEAGVDIDFPVVYRTFGPLDAIAQAAGRCNRHGRAREGLVEVFVPELTDANPYPDGVYRQAAQVAHAVLKQSDGNLDLDNPDVMSRYYRRLYPFRQPDDEIANAIKGLSFISVASQYRVIARNAINVLVCHDRSRFEMLSAEARDVGLSRPWVSRAREHAVSLFRPKDSDPVRRHLEPVTLRSRQREESGDWFIYICNEHYRQDLGLVPPSDECLIA